MKITEPLFKQILFSICSHVFTRPADIRLSKSVVSFTFDDVPSSTYDFAVPLLKQHGYKATFYISGGLADPDKHLRANQIKNLIAGGHEIGCHTFSHLPTTCSPARLKKDIDRNQVFFHQECSYRAARHFAYPFGMIGLWNKLWLRQRYLSLRTTYPGINSGEIDLSALKAYKLYANHFSREGLKDILQENESRRGWLIFYTHDVSPQPSAWGTDVALFKEALALTQKTSCEVMPVGRAVEKILCAG